MALEPQGHYGPPPKRARSPITAGPGERVSNAERDGVIEQLRLNVGEGRLDMDEFGQRCEQALGAKTGSDLRAVIADLPLVEPPEAQVKRRQIARRAILVPYLVVNSFLVMLWLVIGAGRGMEFGTFWPIWPILGWGVGVVFAFVGTSFRGGSDEGTAGSALPPGPPT